MKHRIAVGIAVAASAAALLALAAVPARSAEDVEINVWRRSGPGFACITAPPKGAPPGAVDPDKLALPCLHMGPFAIGGDPRTLTSVLGAPHRTLPQPKGPEAMVWFLEQRDHYPYFIASVRNDRIAALQVTGPAPAKGYGFNHVNLGDSTETLTRYFGQAFRVSKSDLPNTDVWHYGPWPFSFEVNSGRVTSIRIVDPAP